MAVSRELASSVVAPAGASLGQTFQVDTGAAGLLDDQAIELVRELGQWAESRAQELGAHVQERHVRYWQSVEDSQWARLVIEFRVTGGPLVALQFWDDACDKLAGLLQGVAPTPATELLTVRVHWR